MTRRWVRILGLLFFALVATACEGSIDLLIDVEEDGSGLVTVGVELDRETSEQILDLESGSGLPLIDLNEAGWVIEPPTVADNGSTTVGASKAFGNAEQLNDVLAEITGEDNLFRNFELARTKSFARVDYQLTGEIAPAGLQAFADEALTAAIGSSLEELAVEAGGSAADVDVTVRVRLPGSDDGDVASTGTPVQSDDGVERIWTTTLDQTQPTPIVAASSTRNVAPLVWRGIAVVAAVLAGLVLFGHILRLVRPAERRRRRPDGKRPRPSAKGTTAASDRDGPADGEELEEGESVEEVEDEPVIVVLDGMGVLYREGQDIAEILIPFAREMGSEATSDEIVARARSLSLGRITPADFWTMIGVDGEANELDDAYLSRHQLNPGVVKFLRDLRERDVKVACVTNDCTTWANKLRARHSLDGLIDPWVISGAVGVRKPDWPIYEVLRRVTGQPPAAVLVVDDDLDNLDAAREFGFRTAWFAPDGDPAGSRDHAILRSFSVEAPAPAEA